jgi:putative ABC transport system permease protein
VHDWAGEVRSRLVSLRLSPVRENEIVEELSQHLEDRWRELTSGGHSPVEATRLALAEFREGNLLARYMEPLRQAHFRPSMPQGTAAGSTVGDLRHDLQYGLRMLRKQPVFSVAAILTLALGVGSNAAIFSVINAVLLRPLPFPNSGQLVALYSRYLPPTGYDFPFFSLSGPEFADIEKQVNAFSAVAAYDVSSRNMTRADGGAERVVTMGVTAGFFDTLGVTPQRGRAFREADAHRGERCVALLDYDAAGQNERAIGTTIKLDDAPCDVIGVMPSGFAFRDDRVRVWTALAVDTEETSINRQSHALQAIARLRDGVSSSQADAQLQSLRAYWSEQYPDHYAKGHFAVSRPLHEDLSGDQRDALLFLGGAVLLVMLIVCVNLSALLVSKGEARRREFALRHALGASRGRVVRQLIVESMLLTFIGGMVGVLIANTLLAGLLSLYPARLPASPRIAIDYATLTYATTVVLVVGCLLGLIPALNAAGMRMQDTLRAASLASTASRRALAARSILVIGQLALSVILLVGALLLMRSYQHLQRIDLGIEPDHVLTFTVSVPPAHQPNPAGARRLLASLEARLAATPGVDVAGAISNLPVASAGPPDDFIIEGRAEPAEGTPRWNARFLMATPHAFRALGVPLKRGRLFDENDGPDHPLVGVVNETAARLYWSDRDPIGATIRYYPRESSPAIRIVGVVGDVRSMGPALPAPPALYVPYEQAPRPTSPGRTMTFVVRVPGDPAHIVSSARAAVASIDPGLPLANVRPMSDVVSAAAGQPRFTTVVMSLFAGVAFLLAALGLYGILAHSVEQRVREIGVRIALGADHGKIMRMIVGKGMGLAFVGTVVGISGALGMTRMMGGMLSGITGTDPATHAAVVAIVAISALLASYLPARRATRVDPIRALRAE